MVKLGDIPPPPTSTFGANTNPYSPSEIQTLWTTLDRRWPALSADEAARWAERWKHGRSPYWRIRRHAIRSQLDAIIGLALCCGLRRSEICRQRIDWIHPDNAYLVVCDGLGPWKGAARRVPYSHSARALVAPWCRLRDAIAPDKPDAWLNLWSARTVRDPLTRSTFDRILRTHVGAGWRLRRLRDTYIISQIADGVPLEDLSVIVGIARTAHLRPYAQYVARVDESIR